MGCEWEVNAARCELVSVGDANWRGVNDGSAHVEAASPRARPAASEV